MQILLLSCLALAAFLSLSGCTTVEAKPEPTVHTSTTTTEQSTIHRPAGVTTETQTTRSY
jgi:outer membrane protein assembly factor BamE (lipoprotein component of BamABCDE complex)